LSTGSASLTKPHFSSASKEKNTILGNLNLPSTGADPGCSEAALAIKDRMIAELTIENRRLKEELAKTHYSKFRVDQDLLCKYFPTPNLIF
jgi:hypothetical protein